MKAREDIKDLEQQPCEDVPDINDGNIYKCSCGYGWDKNKVVRHHFCPNCGRAVENMSDIEMVIRIPEEKYNQIINFYQESKVRPKDYEIAIINGTPLPKGHGRLIDADKTISEICGSLCGCYLEECGNDNPCYSVAKISSASTIIEADKGSE